MDLHDSALDNCYAIPDKVDAAAFPCMGRLVTGKYSYGRAGHPGLLLDLTLSAGDLRSDGSRHTNPGVPPNRRTGSG